jgi:hypothetical protein
MAQETVAHFKNGLKASSIVVLLLFAILHFFALPGITLTIPEDFYDGSGKKLIMPHHVPNSANAGKQFYELHIDYAKYQDGLFRINPQSCLLRASLNGFPVTFSLNEACNFGSGVLIDLRNMLTEGENILKLETKSPGLFAGPVIFHDEWTLASVVACLLMLASVVWLYYFCGILFGDRISAALVAGSYVCFLNTLLHTHIMWKKYDMPQHLDEADWVQSLATNDKRIKGCVASLPLEKGPAIEPDLARLAKLLEG